MPKRIYSLREIKNVLTHPNIYCHINPLIHEVDYIPDMSCIYYRVGPGLIIYEPDQDSVEMHGALIGGVKPGYAKEVIEQWRELSRMGFKRVKTSHEPSHKAASRMCAMLGMQLVLSDERKHYEVSLNG